MPGDPRRERGELAGGSRYPRSPLRARRRRWFAGGLAAGAALALPFILATRRETPPRPPLGLPPVAWPHDNPHSPAKARLGRLLFFDRRLSSDGTVACASCHFPDRAFSDKTPVSTGIGKQKGRRNAPPLINRAYGRDQFWDARAASLEAQAKAPLADRTEMTTEPDEAAAHRACIARLRVVPGYRRLFKQAFGTEAFTIEHVAKAIATFVRTIYSGNSPYDRYQAGDRTAMTPEQVRGMGLFFGNASCMACHSGPNFTSEIPLNTGVGLRKPKPDRGRFAVTRFEWETGAFKTPTLREIERTAPYMHDGSLKTLEEVIEHYDQGGGPNPHLDDRIIPLALNQQEKKELVAFLKALSGEGWQHIQAPARFPQ